jgi:DeoR/GlpR family transcriptional regulator of sugar metabolism
MDRDAIVWQGLFARGLARRRSFQYTASKARLAKCVVNLLEKQQPRSILLGAGTTVLAVVRELIPRIKDYELNTLQEFYTNNLVALSELLLHGGQINIHVPEGRVVTRDGAIIGNAGIDQLKEKKFDAIITSFYGFHPETGFHSDHEEDKAEKHMNLVANNCSTIYIVLSWEKFGAHHTPVATLEEAFHPDKTYYFVTDPPQKWIDEKTKVIEEEAWGTVWSRDNVTIVYAGSEED